MQQYGSKYFAGRPPPHPNDPRGIWSKGQNSTFVEHGSVTYQIEWNHKMQQHGSK